MLPKPKAPRLDLSVDWLKEKAIERCNKDPKPEFYHKSKELISKLRRSNTKSIEEAINQFEMVKTFSQVIEEKSKHKEKALRNSNDASMQEINDLNNLWVENVKSKIMLLDNISL